MTTDWPDYNPSQHRADAIAGTGVPLLSKSTNLFNLGNTIIVAGGSSTQGPVPITQIGYEVFISLGCVVGSLSPFVTVQLTWTDSVSGRAVAIEQWDLAAVSGSLFQQYVGTGPTKGDTLSITVTNTDASNIMTYVLSFVQNSRVYTRDDWRQATAHTPPGFTNAAMSPGALILGSTNASIAAGGFNSRLLSLYAGQCRLAVNNAGQGLGISISAIADPTIGLGSGGASIYANNVAANGFLNTDFDLPRSVCLMTLTNMSATTAMSPLVTVIAGTLLT